MDKLKFILFSIVMLSLLGFVGYWSIITIQSGTEHSIDQRIKNIEEENENLRNEVQKQKSEISALEARLGESTPSTIIEPEEPEITVHKYQDLIDELQKLADENIFLKQKSSGPRVGTVQEFLNIYNGTSNRVDNDYGPGTANALMVFQKEQGLTADGEAGPITFNKMINWLETEE